MKNRVYIFSFAVVLLLSVVQCSKYIPESELPEITFGVSAIGVDVSTKGLITNFTGSPVYVYAVRNNTTPVFTVFPAVNNVAQIIKNNDNELWKASGDHIYQWMSGSSYSFHGYTSSPSSPGNGASLTVESYGLKFTVTQPTTYSENNMVDYMLSHSYKVANGSSSQVVMLNMEHAMSWIEIEVYKEPEHEVKVSNIILSDIYSSATMVSEKQAIYGSNENNIWAITYNGTNDQDYEKIFTYENDAYPYVNNPDTPIGTMRVLAVPQQLKAATKLSITYKVKEFGGIENTYTQIFNLFNYTPYIWEPGHKITYKLKINTGVQLEAKVADWGNGGYIEGVIKR